MITNAEQFRKQGNTVSAHVLAAETRMRPIVMTGMAMIAGMLPMALGFGENGGQTAPLGIAVIGGLLLSTISILFFLPFVYRYVVGNRQYVSASMDPDDLNSKNFMQQ